MGREKVIFELTDMLRKVSDTSAALSESTSIVKDVGLESIQVIEYLCEVEDHYEIIINEEKIGKVQTVGDLATVVIELKGG